MGDDALMCLLLVAAVLVHTCVKIRRTGHQKKSILLYDHLNNYSENHNSDRDSQHL